MAKWLIVLAIVIVTGLAGWWWFLGLRLASGGRITVLAFDKQVQITSFDPQTRQGVRVTIPDNLEIEGLDGRAKWLIGVLPEVEKKLHKPGWAARSVSQYLGVAYTFEAARMSWAVKWRIDQLGRDVGWQDIDVTQENILEEAKTVDGVEYFTLGSRWAGEARNWFVDSALATENIDVKIVNTTGLAGMGTRAGNVLETAGVKVGEITTSNTGVDKCLITVGPGGKKWATTNFVMANFACNVREDAQLGRALHLELGREYQSEWVGAS